MINHIDLTDKVLYQKIKNRKITLGGNRNLKIYGLLSCKSGKRMHKSNRVFFASITEAEMQGYRPCGHCQKNAYKNWKNGLI